MGCESKMGVTHLSIALASYLAVVLGVKTALVELGEKNALTQIFPFEPKDKYQMNGVSYFPNRKSNEIGQIMNQNFQYIIFDLGSESIMAKEEMMRCDGKIMIGSLSPWRKNVYYEFIKNIGTFMGDTSGCTFLSLFGDKIENIKCRRVCKVPVRSVPFIADPFQIEKPEITFLHTLV